ncbi:MAG: hypothetical protein EOP88_18920 [Verrucomicrobiaceae bacterium]|nr:MAG: hypothetical protein EOP88_18920 [Verrucomicrobiaceae bacterium]
MNENDNIPVNEAPTTTGEGVAERYVDSELKKAKGSLLRTQIGSVLAVLILGGYTMYLTNRFKASLEPHEAATIAQGLVAQKLDDGSVQFADYVKKEVPNYIRQAPDYAKKQLPEYRQQIETRVNTEIENYAKQTADQLGAELDKFLDQNKEAVGELLKNGQDPAATAKITGQMKELFAGMRVTVKVVVEPGISATTASYVEDDTITLVDMDFGKMMEKPGAIRKMATMGQGNPEKAMEEMKKLDGVKVETKPQVEVTLN